MSEQQIAEALQAVVERAGMAHDKGRLREDVALFYVAELRLAGVSAEIYDETDIRIDDFVVVFRGNDDMEATIIRKARTNMVH